MNEDRTAEPNLGSALVKLGSATAAGDRGCAHSAARRADRACAEGLWSNARVRLSTAYHLP